MAQSKREQYERKRAHIRELAEGGEIQEDDADAILTWLDAYDDEKATATPNSNGNDEYIGDDRWGTSRAPSTLRQWAIGVSTYARELNGSIFDATTEDLNQTSQDFYDGDAEVLSTRAKNTGGLSKNSVSTRQKSLRKFLQHYDDRATAGQGELHIFDNESSLVDPDDMLTQEEFHAFRNAPEHPRDRAIANLFLYTGQRNNAIRTLRIKDIDLEDGKYRLNGDADGLKGADLVATWNPLLAATGALRDWLQHHPAPDDPDAYLLTERRDHRERDPYSTISDDTVNRALRRAAKKAAEEYPAIDRKPVNAHAMRHNFVTMCKVVYDMDNDTIKRLIRHKPDSTVMETTYAHLSDEDYIRKAEKAFGMRDEDNEEFDPSPEICDVCREPLPPGAKACSNCGEVFSLDAKHSQNILTEKLREKKEEAETLEAYKKLDRLEQAISDAPEIHVDDPEIQKLIEEL